MADAASAAKPQKKHGRKARQREQRKPLRSAAPTAIPAAIRNALPAGDGEPLPPPVVARMSERFGADFSRVRVHTDSLADEAAHALGARAFTVGDHVVFSDGRYRPDTYEGERLLAHELAHVVQQSRGGARQHPADPDAGLESGADAAAAQALAGAGAVHVAGASGVGVACEPEPKEATAKRRIVKAMGELQRLEGAVAESKKDGRSITGADSTRAFDAITLARSEARASKNPTLIGVADGLIDQFDAATRGTQAERPPNSFEQHPAASAMPMTPDEANRTVTAQRGFGAGLSAGKLADARAELELLESAEKAAGDQKARDEFRKKIEALKRRIAISTPTLKSAEELTRQKAVLDKQLTQATKPAERQRLQVQIDSLKQQIDAVKAANANPDARPALPAMQGGRLGHSGATFVTIQIVGADGKLITTVQARNDTTRHAEVVILQQLEELPDKAGLKGATMIVSGDQEVCKKCTPEVAKFAKKYKFKEAYGDTGNAPQITSSGKLTGKDATAKTTIGKVADPAAVDKLEKAQGAAGLAGPEGKVQLKNKRFLIYSDPDQGTAAPPSTTTKPKAPPQVSAKPAAPAGAKQLASKPPAGPKSNAAPKPPANASSSLSSAAKPPSKLTPPKPPVAPKIQPPKPNAAAMRAPRLSGLKSYGRGVAGAGATAAVGFLAEVIVAKIRQEEMEKLVNEKIPPLVEAGMAKLSDELYRKQIAKPGDTLYWNVTIEISTISDMRGTSNLSPEVMAVNLSWDNKNSSKDSVEAGFGHAFQKTTVTYSFPAEEAPFDDLVQYAASQNMPMDALRAYAKKQISDIETPDPNTTVDPEQVQILRTRWVNKLASLEEHDLGVKQRKSEQARKQKAADDKLDREKLDRMLAADKQKASQKPPANIPGLMPPGQSSVSSAPLKIGPFDAFPEVTPGQRGELIASKYEQEKEKWVKDAAKMKLDYHDGNVSNERFAQFRNRRDEWVAGLNRYAEAMSKVPEMKNGAGRMKALQDWLANDGHNAIMDF